MGVTLTEIDGPRRDWQSWRDTGATTVATLTVVTVLVLYSARATMPACDMAYCNAMRTHRGGSSKLIDAEGVGTWTCEQVR